MADTSKPNAFLEWFSALRRRRVPVLLTFAGMVLVTLLAAFFWPATYRSTGTILIEQQEVPTDLVRSAIPAFADQRIQTISQRVMTTENLFKIIDHYNLYAKMRQSAPREKIIKQAREDIALQIISADVIDPREGRPTKATIAFSVSFTNRSPDVAARVANELVSLYLQVNIQNRRQQAATSTTFLADAAEKLNARIVELQGQIATFKAKNLNNLPELSPLNLQLMNHTDDDLRDIDTQIRSLDQQIVYLNGQLAQLSPSSQVYTSTGERVLSPSDRLKFLRTEYARVSALYSPDHPDVIRLQREIEGLESTANDVDSTNDQSRQLEDAQTQLAAASKKYSADYPDVVRLQKMVDSLRQDLAKVGQTAIIAKPEAKADNPAYIELKAQAQGAVNQRTALIGKREELKTKLEGFESRMARTPGVERDYSALVHDLDNTQLEYREIRQKRTVAQQSENLEDQDKGERFTLIEPPVPPQQPASPNRFAIVALGFVLALGAAIGLTALLEMLDTSVRNRRDLEALLTVPPLAVLPMIETKADRRALVMRQRYALGATVATLVIALTLTQLFYRPLDVLWQVALRKFLG